MHACMMYLEGSSADQGIRWGTEVCNGSTLLDCTLGEPFHAERRYADIDPHVMTSLQLACQGRLAERNTCCLGSALRMSVG